MLKVRTVSRKHQHPWQGTHSDSCIVCESQEMVDVGAPLDLEAFYCSHKERCTNWWQQLGQTVWGLLPGEMDVDGMWSGPIHLHVVTVRQACYDSLQPSIAPMAWHGFLWPGIAPIAWFCSCSLVSLLWPGITPTEWLQQNDGVQQTSVPSSPPYLKVNAWWEADKGCVCEIIVAPWESGEKERVWLCSTKLCYKRQRLALVILSCLAALRKHVTFFLPHLKTWTKRPSKHNPQIALSNRTWVREVSCHFPNCEHMICSSSWIMM